MTDNDNSYAGLTNEELVLIHDRFKFYLDELNTKLDKNIVHEKIILPKVGEAIKVHHLTNEQVNSFKNTKYYKFTNSIVKKLSPIKELIKESVPEILENISENE